LPVLLLSQPAVTIAPLDTRRMLIFAVAVPLIMLAVSPLLAILAQRGGPAPASAHASLLAAQIEREWHSITPQPLRFVGGEADLAYGVISYTKDRPRALTDMPQPSAAELAQGGQVIVCFVEDGGCRRTAGALANNKIIESGITRNFLGFAGQPQRYSIAIVPPWP
jgi:hypothetical protein